MAYRCSSLAEPAVQEAQEKTLVAINFFFFFFTVINSSSAQTVSGIP